MQATDIKIVIIGAGIAGLASAYFLQSKKYSVKILERDTEFNSKRQGFSLTMQKDTRDILQEYGLLDEMFEKGYRSKKQTFYNHNGEILYQDATNDVTRFNFPLPRQELRRLFYSKLKPNTIVWGEKITNIDATDNGCILLTDKNERYFSDFVIAADGVNSSIRKQYYPDLNLNDLKLCNIYGIVDLSKLEKENFDVFNSSEVQILDGEHRFFSKPFDNTKQMWELTWKSSNNSPIFNFV